MENTFTEVEAKVDINYEPAVKGKLDDNAGNNIVKVSLQLLLWMNNKKGALNKMPYNLESNKNM